MKKILFTITIIVIAITFILTLIRSEDKQVSAQSNSCINSTFFTSDKFNFNAFNTEFPGCGTTPRCFQRRNSQTNELEYCTPTTPHMASSESFANSRASDKDECVSMIAEHIADVNTRNDFLNAADTINDWGGFYMELTTSGGNETRHIDRCDPNEASENPEVQCLNNYFSNNNFDLAGYTSTNPRCGGTTPQCFTTQVDGLYKFCQTGGIYQELTDLTRDQMDSFKTECRSILLPFFASDTLSNNFISDLGNEANWKGFAFTSDATISQCNLLDLASVQLKEETSQCDYSYQTKTLINRTDYDRIVDSYGGCSIENVEPSSIELLPACHTDTINGIKYYCPSESKPIGTDAILLSDFQKESVENQILEMNTCLGIFEGYGADIGTTPFISDVCPWQGVNFDVAAQQLISRDQTFIDFVEDEYEITADETRLEVGLLISSLPKGRDISVDLQLKKDDIVLDSTTVIWEDGDQEENKKVTLALPSEKKAGDTFSLNLNNPQSILAKGINDNKVLASSSILGFSINSDKIVSQLSVGDISIKRALISIKVINPKPVGCELEDDGQPNVSCQKCIDAGGIWIAIGCVDPTPLGIMTRIVQTGIGVMGGVALVQLIIVGLYLQSGQEAKIAEGKKKLIATLTGIVVLVFSVLILRIIGVNVLDAVPGGFL